MVSAILTGVFDLAPTKLYKVGTMQEIPKPTSIGIIRRMESLRRKAEKIWRHVSTCER